MPRRLCYKRRMWRRWWWLGVTSFLLCGAIRLAYGAEAVQPGAILIDALTGQSLREQNADAVLRSGSLNQLMVLLLSLEEADMDALPLNAPVTVSATAASRAAVNQTRARATTKHAKRAKRMQEKTVPALPEQLSLRSDKAYLLSDLLKAMLVTSSDEAAIAAAEAIAGSAPACVELMNARAQRLGMEATRYASIVGDGPADADTTTARDIARLAHALVQHSAVVQWSSLTGLPFDQGAILLRNVNQLIGTVPGVDGLQVSAPSAARSAGYSIVATAQRGPLRLIAVVMDAPSSADRYSAAAELLEWGFAHYERLEIVRQDEALNFPIYVRHGVVRDVTPVAGKTFSLLRRRDEEHDLQLRYQLPMVVTAPLKRHQQVGEIIVEEKGQLIGVVPALSPVEVRSGGFLAAALP
jgi:D-alanyl-D-alanine carboxypeptidase (penicillin-binding protein 5/6)